MKYCAMFFTITLHFSFILLAVGVIINENVDRNVNLTTQIVKIRENITFQNGYKRNITSYSYILENPINSYVEFYQDKKKLANEIVVYKNETYQEYIVKLLRPVKSFDKDTIRVKVLRTNNVRLLNKKRKPGESQVYEFTSNAFIYSKYITKNFKCVVDVKNTILELSENFHTDDGRIIYKVIELRPYSKRRFKLVFENNEPSYEVNDLERTIYVSHYGKILVEEKINISNAGSSVEGPYDSINTKRIWFHTYLPASAENIRFYDILGNNSKTELSKYTNFKMLYFQLRYPLLSGWKSEYNLQYTLPLYEYLKSDYNGKFLLRMRIIDHILNDVVIKNARIKIVLPEGTRIETLNYAGEFYRSNEELSFTSLAFYGRPTVVFSGNTLTKSHIVPFDVVYNISQFQYYRIPLILSGYVQIVFLVAIAIRYFKNLNN